MKSLTLNVPQSGLHLNLIALGGTDAQVVLVAPDEVRITEMEISSSAIRKLRKPAEAELFLERPIAPIINANGFPPRQLTQQIILQIIQEHGGAVKIRDAASGWNIYDEIAARLGVSMEARRRLTVGTGEPAWRPEVGFARKNLEQAGIIEPTEKSGRGIWALFA
jgi:hypothetical protein